jgi:tetratricopeptide (TPR) repeat protein
MRYRIWILLLLLSTNCYSQGKVRPSVDDRYAEFNPGSQLMRSLSKPDNALVNSAPQGPGKISLEELRLPSKAVHELERSAKAYESRDWRGAAVHLEKVLLIDPHYWPAHSKLGKLYVTLHEYDRAMDEFTKASANDPLLAEPLNKLSATLFLLERYSEAERVARATLQVDPARIETRYLLVCSLVAQKRFTAETLALLKLSSSQISNTRLVLAGVLCGRGALEEATAELRVYLEVPDASRKE